MKTSFLIIILFLPCLPFLQGATLAEANALYLDKKYEQAVEAYEEILTTSPSAIAHYNVAQAYRNLEKNGRAAYHLTQSLKLQPRATDALEQLSNLYQNIGYKLPHRKTYYQFVYLLSPQEWLLLATICGWMAGGGFLWWGFARRKLFPTIILGVSIPLLLPAGISLLFFHQQAEQAIILEESMVKISPTSKAESMITLPEGTWVTVHRQENDHWEISLPSEEQTGWIESAQMKKIW